jgi:hypothetical protein
MVIAFATSDSAWTPGYPVSRMVASVDDQFKGSASDWRWVGKQISNKDQSAGNWCLTTVPAKGDEIVIDKCSNTATLTQWDVTLAK